MSKERIKLRSLLIEKLDNGYTVTFTRYNPYGANPSSSLFYPTVGELGSAIMLALMTEEKEIAEDKLKTKED